MRITKSRTMPALLIFLSSVSFLPSQLSAQDSGFDDIVADTTPMEGYFNLYWQESSGKMFWEIDKLNTEFLYLVSMGSGLGSNPVG
ncbi:MAG: DUF5118 domain-containing protein, partial [Chromatocurvus sp.]